MYVSPSYADGKIYVVTSERHLYVLDTSSNGAKIADATTPSSCWSSPTLANGKLYIGSNDWNVYCYTSYITSETPVAPTGGMDEGFVLTLATVVVVAVLVAVAVGYVIYRRARKKP